MRERKNYRTLIVWVGLLSSVEGMTEEAESTKPNLLFIYTDDQRWDAISYITPHVFTPNLEKLSQQGRRFTQAVVVLPVCSPSRAAALTGRYGMVNGQTTYADTNLKPSEILYSEYLKEAGYLTAHIGKWHIYGQDPHGKFDEVRNTENTRYFWQTKVINNGVAQRAPGKTHDYLINETISIIRSATEKKKPFAIYLATTEPHSKMFGDKRNNGGAEKWMSDETRLYYEKNPLSSLPVPPNIYDDLGGKPPYLLGYRGRVQRVGATGRKAMTPERYRESQYMWFILITELDHALGRLIYALEENGLMRNTFIIFMGDNGTFHGEHGFMSKGLHYEESVRVPFFAVGPGIAPGLDEKSLVSNLDIAPTLLDFAGLPIPENMHGASLKPVLLEDKPFEREYVMLEHPDFNPELETRTAYSLRSKKWKYIRTYEDGRDSPHTFEELYDLENDPFEMNNLAADPERGPLLQSLRDRLETNRAQIH